MNEGTPSAPPRVLVVDDDDAIRALLTRYLRLEGYEVEEAADGQSAVSSVERRTPDLVLLDRMLPAHDGLDILARMRRITDVPIILLTAMGAEGDRVMGLKLGADDYVVKPFSPPELVARISSVLRRTQSTHAPSRLEFDGLVVDEQP